VKSCPLVLLIWPMLEACPLYMSESSSPCVLIVPSLEARISGGVARPFVVSSSLIEIHGIVPCLKAFPFYSFHAGKLVPLFLNSSHA